jgi:hypothetical protein
MDKTPIFKLCKRLKLKDAEKKILIDNSTILNGVGENVLHNYCKHNGFDLKLMTDMINAGHDINNINRSGYSSFHSCLQYSSLKPQDFIKKLHFIIDNNFPLVVPKIDLTNFVLCDHFIIRKLYKFH